MLPTDLKLLIEFEQEDYNDRVAAARLNQDQYRRCFFSFFFVQFSNFHRTNI